MTTKKTTTPKPFKYRLSDKAIAQKKMVAIAHADEHELTYFNQAIVLAGQAKEIILPIQSDPFLNLGPI